MMADSTQVLPLPILLPLASSVVYVVAALFLKRASEAGAGVWRTTRVCNVMTAVFFAPLWLLGGTIPGAAEWWQPALVEDQEVWALIAPDPRGLGTCLNSVYCRAR
jgi:hypothetical protein